MLISKLEQFVRSSGTVYLFVAIVLIVFGAIDRSLYPGYFYWAPLATSPWRSCWLLILPSLAVSVRRLHDIDRTGWWVLIAATAIGTLVLIYLGMPCQAHRVLTAFDKSGPLFACFSLLRCTHQRPRAKLPKRESAPGWGQRPAKTV